MGGEKLEGGGRGETLIRIWYMKEKNPIFNKRWPINNFKVSTTALLAMNTVLHNGLPERIHLAQLCTP